MNIIAPAQNQPAPDGVKASPTREEAEAAIRTLLLWAGDDPNREGLRDTPSRVARAYQEFFTGYGTDPFALLERTFEETDGYDEIVLLRDIRLESTCEHHMAPIIGRVHVAYLPHRRVVGISKLARVVDAYAKRLQIQEKLTAQIANTIQDVPGAARRCGCRRSRSSMHDNARCSQTWRHHGHEPHAGRIPGQFRHKARIAVHDRKPGDRDLQRIRCAGILTSEVADPTDPAERVYRALPMRPASS